MTITGSSPKKNPPSYADIASFGNSKKIDEASKAMEVVAVAGAVAGSVAGAVARTVATTDAPAFTAPATVAIGTALESADTSHSPKNLYSIFFKTPSKSPALTGLGKTRVATTSLMTQLVVLLLVAASILSTTRGYLPQTSQAPRRLRRRPQLVPMQMLQLLLLSLPPMKLLGHQV